MKDSSRLGGVVRFFYRVGPGRLQKVVTGGRGGGRAAQCCTLAAKSSGGQGAMIELQLCLTASSFPKE